MIECYRCALLRIRNRILPGLFWLSPMSDYCEEHTISNWRWLKPQVRTFIDMDDLEFADTVRRHSSWREHESI